MDRQSCLGRHTSLRRAANIATLLLIATVTFLLVGPVSCSSSSVPNSPANVVNVDSEYNTNFSSVTVRRLVNSRSDGVVSRRILSTPCPVDPTGNGNCPQPCPPGRFPKRGTCAPV